MESKQTLPERVAIKGGIAGRLRLVRLELYGEDGLPRLADLLKVPHGTWANYERGVTIPGEVLLEFLALTDIEPVWLLREVGQKYRVASP